MLYFILGVILVLNLRSFILMGIDKKRSITQQYRISEKTLLSSAWSLGSIGFILGMKKFKHKTLKKSFVWTGRLSLTFHLLITGLLIYIYYIKFYKGLN